MLFTVIKTKYQKVSLWYLVLIFISFSAVAFAANAISSAEIDDMLSHAYNIKSKDVEKFQSSIIQLNSEKETFNRSQLFYLSYLNGYSDAYNGRLEKAQSTFKSILKSDAPIKVKFKANLALLSSLAVSKNWSDGMTFLSNNLRLLPKINDTELEQLGNIAALQLYNQYEQYGKVLNFAEQLNIEDFTDKSKCFLNSFIIEAKFNLNLLLDFNPKIDQGIKHCESINEHMVANLIRFYLASFYMKDNNPTRALDILIIHLPNTEKAGYPWLTINVYSAIAKGFYQKDNINRAEEFALKAVNFTQGLETTKPVVDAYQLLYTIEKNRGNTSAALTYHEKYTTADKAYMNEVSAKQVAFQLAQHKQAEQAQQIQYLDEKNNLLEIEKELVEARDRNNKLLVALLTAVVIILMLIVYRIKVSNKKLRELAEFDVLTGAYNRGHFAQEANTAISYCKKTEQEISLVLFDLDYFKLINDRHGHACGDWALRQTIETCRTIGRKNDVFARLGGEEFCILLPTCDATAATLLAEQCRKEIAEIDSTPSGFDFTITASFGVTCAKTSGYTLETLLANADQAMYKSKNNGRNRVTLFSQD